MEIDLDLVRRSFAAESDEDLTIVEQALLSLEKAPGDRELLATVFRKFHALKGNASSVGFERLGGFAHRIEDLLEHLREGHDPVTPELITYLLRVVDATREMIPAVLAGQEELSPACEALLRQIEGGHLQAQAAPGTPSRETRAPAGEAYADRDLEAGVHAARTLRIDVDKLDLLLDVTSEIAIARGRLGLIIQEHGTADVAAEYRTMERLLTNLHQFVSQVRMVPIGPLLQHYTRVVRDLALTHGKQAELVIRDQGVEVDTSIVEQLKAPLTQVIRNAVSHGLETSEARRRAGKPPTGRIEIRARHEASDIVIEVEDDGSGLDRRRILERAHALGIVAAGPAPSDRDVDRLIFHPGLSTAVDVTSTSGRGVGMDVVLQQLDALGGSVDVASQMGRGTVFTVRMPLTLAIIDGLLVQTGTETFVLPLADVVHCVDLPATPDPSLPDGVLNVRGQAMPFLRLRSVLGSRRADSAAGEVVVVVQRGEQQLGLVVDELGGKTQIVVKPPGRFFEGLPAVAGMTILGSGQVAPILNVAGLVQRYCGAQSLSAPAGGDHA